MSMIKIKKGATSLTVTEAAYNDYYKPFGWKKVNVKKEKEVVSGEQDEQEEFESDEYEPEKPAREMTGRELRKYAESIGLKGKYNNREELLAAVIEHQKNN